jgi:hypothetical protein
MTCPHSLRSKRSIYRQQSISPAFPFPPSSLDNRTLQDGLLTSMSTLDNAFRLRWSSNGNTYAVEEKKVPDDIKSKEWSGWFATDATGNLIYGDSHGRLFHGYIESLQILDFSRLRLHASHGVPQTAWPVGNVQCTNYKLETCTNFVHQSLGHVRRYHSR